MLFRYAILAVTAHSTSVRLPNGLQLRGETVLSRYRIGEGDAQVDQYLGIPFADPPVGELRFRSPRQYSGSWEGEKEFMSTPADCYTGKARTSEDCLYLNVFRPGGTLASASLPVMVWIFGGGFNSGRIGGYNGTELAAREGVVLVVPAYRLGAFGFMASEATLVESGTTGNWGLLDQRMALEWVQTNIGSFGGDKNRVTLFGHSAGAMSIAAHLTSAGSHGYFHKAILSSPSASSPYFFRPLADSVRFGDWTAQTAGCLNADDLECLRSVPASRLVVASGSRDVNPPAWASRLFPFMPFGITIDGVVLTATPLVLAREGKAANIPVMIGLVQEEGAAFSMILDSFIRPKFKGDIPEDRLADITTHLLGNHDGFVDKYIREEFPAYRKVWEPFFPDLFRTTTTPSPGGQTAPDLALFSEQDLSTASRDELFGILPILASKLPKSEVPNFDRAPLQFYKDSLKDSIFACSSLAFADAIGGKNGGRVWFYHFDLDIWDDTPWNLVTTRSGNPAGNSMTMADLGAFHGSELPFIWNQFPTENVLPSTLGNSATIFTSFTAPQFCPADSFKRTSANQMGCLWSNFAKCGSPQCTSDGDQCGVSSDWGTFPKLMHIHDKGEFTSTEVPSGHERVGAILPSNQQCKKWLNRDIPFIKLSPDPPLAANVAKNAFGMSFPISVMSIILARMLLT